MTQAWVEFSNLKIAFVTSQQLNTKWITARFLLHWHKWQNKKWLYIYHYINVLWLEITTISVTRAYMFQVDPFKLSHLISLHISHKALPLDVHPSNPCKNKMVLLCRCQLQSIRRSNKSRACGQCQHGYNLTQVHHWIWPMGSTSSKAPKIGKIPSFGPSKNLGPHRLASTKDAF